MSLLLSRAVTLQVVSFDLIKVCNNFIIKYKVTEASWVRDPLFKSPIAAVLMNFDQEWPYL